VGVLSSGDVFQQVDRFDGSATAYNLLLQPRGGKVGIGVTSATQTLHIVGADATEPTLGTAPSAGVSILGSNGGYGLFFGQNGGTGASWLQSMRNDSAVAYPLNLQPSGGNVGIGTSTPAQKLHISGSDLYTNDYGILTISDSSSPKKLISMGMDGTNNVGHIQAVNSGSAYLPLALNANGGNVGIGTASPVGKLNVQSTSQGSGFRVSSNNASITNAQGINIWDSGSSPDAGFISFGDGTGWKMHIAKTSDAGATKFVTFTDSGNVGIGTTTPTQKLVVVGGNIRLSNNQSLMFGDSAEADVPLIKVDTSNQALFTNGNNAAFVFSTGFSSNANNNYIFQTNGGTERVRFQYDGNVGIATTTPWRTLAVTGTVGFDGLTGSTGAGSLCLDSNKQVVYNSASDSCLPSLRETKNNIADLSINALEVLQNLDAVSSAINPYLVLPSPWL
jgi:hypothetical protein